MKTTSTKLWCAPLVLCSVIGLSATAAVTSTASMSDQEIAQVLKQANDSEIGAGTLATTRAEKPAVRAYAKKMIDAHKKSNTDEKAFLSTSITSPAETDMSKAMRDESSAQQAELQKMSGSAFDQAYMKEQIAMHVQLLKDLDQRFIPAAKDEKLKSFLKTTRKHVNEHLSSAQQVVSMMNEGL